MVTGGGEGKGGNDESECVLQVCNVSHSVDHLMSIE